MPRVLLAREAPVGGSGVAGLGLLADLSLVGAFLLGVEMFVTLNFFLPTERIIDSVPVPSFFLLVPLKDGRWALFPSIR